MLPRNLKKLRLELGLTQGYCAEQMHLSRQTILNIEKGKVTRDATLYYYELYLKRKRDDVQRELARAVLV